MTELFEEIDGDENRFEQDADGVTEVAPVEADWTADPQ